MRTADLTGALLDYWVARAEGVPAAELEIREVPRTDWKICVRSVWDIAGLGGQCVERIDYSTNWVRAGRLLEKRKVNLTEPDPLERHVDPSLDNKWKSAIVNYETRMYEHHSFGETPMIAICRAVVRAAFGDEVEDLP